MKKHLLTTEVSRNRTPLWMLLILFFTFLYGIAGAQHYGTPTRVEAENGFNANVTTSSAGTGYSGSGYVTGITTTNSQIKFDYGTNSLIPTKVDIRYANGSSTNITNLAFYVGSNTKIQDLVLPPTGSWSTWATLTVTFNHDPSWGSNMVVNGTSNVSTSASIDYFDVSIDDGTTPAAATPTFSPAAGTYTSAQSVTISTTTPSATIYYTTDGSTPTTLSSVYSSAISVASSKTIKAIATSASTSNSAVGSATYTINLPAVATPTFSPAAGTYTTTQSVTISTATSGSTIYYTTDGSTPTTSSTVYSAAISVASTKTIKAIAAKSGMSNSAVASALYTINVPTVATPTFSPAAGTYTTTQSVTISTTTSGASIRYTTDGSTPTASSTLYSAPISVASTQTIKAIGIASGFSNSAVGSASYTISAGTVATPTFSPAAGTYTSAQSVTLSTTTSGATIYYTTDGSTPTTSSAVYSAAINAGATQTIKAIAAKSGMTTSSVASALYTINIPPPAPGTFTQTAPANGTTSVSRTPTFTWAASSNAASYTLVVSTSSSYASPVINQTGITGTSYTSGTQLAASTVYYWKVTSTNSSSSTVATNAGISFTTTVAVTGISAYNTIQAESYTAQSGVVNQGTFIGNLENNDWVRYDNVDFGTGVNQFSAYLAIDPGYAGQKIELHLGSVTGTLVGTLITVSTGGFNVFATQTTAVSGAVGVQSLFLVFKGTEGIGNVDSFVFADNTLPKTFTLTAPASGSSGVSVTPTFSWSPSSTNATYSLVVSANSSYTNPAITVTGLTTTSYTPGTAMGGNTVYYWKVTAVNSTGSTTATNAGITFTTLTPPAPGAFSQTAPVSGATGIARLTQFKWNASSNAATYTLTVATNSALTSPVINATGLTVTSYTPSAALAVNTLYYWRVTGINTTGSTVATNSGISFTTGATLGTTYFVSTTGVDSPGNGSSANPFKTVAYAASQVAGGLNNTIFINAGTYTETQPVVLALGVNIQGAGQASTTLKSSGVALAPGIDPANADYKLWFDGTLIQLTSPIYTGTNPKYGDPTQMIAAADGNQTISDITIDGNSKSLKAGVWVENRNNVIMHDVSIKNCAMRGAVFSRGDMWWYQAMPEGKWMYNTTVYNCTFLNNGVDLSGESLGNLCLGGLDGANIYNITVNENQGYGIKFIHVGHFRNMKIHDCTITVPEYDPNWSEDISMELWNFSYNNEIYNITCNTWFSLVNHSQFDDYQPTDAHPSNILVHNIKMIDQDGVSVKESIECALSGVTIYDSYFQDKAIGIAIWGGTGWGGDVANHNNTVRNNIFAGVVRTPVNGFGNGSAVFIPDGAYNIKIYNNVFDKMLNGLQLNGATSADVKNNVFINTDGDDVQGGSNITFNNNLKYHTNPAKVNWSLSGGPTLGSNNVLGNPGFLNTGNRWDTYYQPASASSLVVDKGINVGIPFNGSAPDIGRWEFGGGGGRMATSEVSTSALSNNVHLYPNPSSGIIHIENTPDVKISHVEIMNAQGNAILTTLPNSSNQIEIDISQYSNDIYILRIHHDKGVMNKKVILQK